ncbi:hypothetical protein [Aeromonas sobria]|uniref:hypothetical protein n=1 Tax=Aeromonas sobria TaxID=646 RepID=UPI003F387953
MQFFAVDFLVGSSSLSSRFYIFPFNQAVFRPGTCHFRAVAMSKINSSNMLEAKLTIFFFEQSGVVRPFNTVDGVINNKPLLAVPSGMLKSHFSINRAVNA